MILHCDYNESYLCDYLLEHAREIQLRASVGNRAAREIMALVNRAQQAPSNLNFHHLFLHLNEYRLALEN